MYCFTISTNTRARLMMLVAVVFFIYAILWALAPFSSINLPARFILDISDWPLDNLSAPLDRNTQWLSAISSGLLAAVSIFLAGIVVPAIKENNKSVINTAIFAMLTWYTIDGVGSIAAGVTSNVFFNTVYLILILIPLTGCKKEGSVQK